MRFLAATLTPLVLAVASPAFAQAHDPSAHPPATQSPPAAPEQVTPPDPHAGHQPVAPAATPADPHAGHDMSAMTMEESPEAADPQADHDMTAMTMPWPTTTPDPNAGHDTSAMTLPDVETSADNAGRPPEQAPPSAALGPPDYAADLYFDLAEMAAARRQLLAENGDIRTRVVIFDRLEASFADDQEGYAWDAQGWYGGDTHRFWWKSEGEGAFDGELETAEVQALYSRAFTPYFDFQAGVRQTYRPEGDRTDLVVGVQGLAPYWFDVDAAAFLSNKGELTARAEAEYELRLTQRLILQPRAELNLSAEDIPELAIGAGLSSAEVGVRLRYEVHREFAPYVGVEWTSSFGDTRDFIEARGGDAEVTRLVVGVRAWF